MTPVQWPSDMGDQVALERSILKTVLYSDLFDYPLTPDEVAYYLIGVAASIDQVRASLCAPRWLDGQLAQADGYVMACGREALVERRIDRARSSGRLWRRARRWLSALSLMPFVRMIGVTGALAMNNSGEGDDIDVMIVTAPDRVWLTRALAVLLVYIGKVFGDTLCPNYVISERALQLEHHTLFVAHEFTQMVPVYGRTLYDKMRAANQWIDSFLPNAAQPLHAESEIRPGSIGRAIKRLAERGLSGRIGDRLEAWEMRRKLRKFQAQLGQPDGDAILDRDHVKGHFNDYGGPVMRLYAERLRQCLSDPGTARHATRAPTACSAVCPGQRPGGAQAGASVSDE